MIDQARLRSKRHRCISDATDRSLQVASEQIYFTSSAMIRDDLSDDVCRQDDDVFSASGLVTGAS